MFADDRDSLDETREEMNFQVEVWRETLMPCLGDTNLKGKWECDFCSV